MVIWREDKTSETPANQILPSIPRNMLVQPISMAEKYQRRQRKPIILRHFLRHWPRPADSGSDTDVFPICRTLICQMSRALREM
ncbi:hypothetical protein RRG08_028324 [Elysia crispata]|uniref:Uncharacterized protein n=1 Tax=Elysia crispata TaxID=231223 RepID=A0AAE1AWD4_9GAST|nr:hypothetical protein RRG08_028324 [Elysia crispata]